MTSARLRMHAPAAAVALAFALLAACGRAETTREGLGLVQQDTSELIPAEVRTRLAGVPRRQVSRSVPVGAGNDAEVEARLTLVSDPDTGRSYIEIVRLVVARNERYVLAAAAAEEAGEREGGEQPVMAVEYSVSFTDPASGSEGARRFRVLSDGRLDLL